MNIQAKRDMYAKRLDDYEKGQRALSQELDRVNKTILGLQGAIEALDELIREEAELKSVPDPAQTAPDQTQ